MFNTTFDAKAKTWSGPKIEPMFNTKVSLGYVILETLKFNANKVGQISDNNGVRMTNAEIRQKAIRSAQHLQKLGFGMGDVFAFIAPNHHNIAPLVFAAFAIGAPANTLDPNLETDEMTQMLDMTKPKLIFCDADVIGVVQESLKSLNVSTPIYTLGGTVNGARSADELFAETGNEDDFLTTDIVDGTQLPAAIICSSGTTGPSKGVILSHASVLERIHSPMDVTVDDIMFCASSLYWLSGFGTLIQTTLKGMTRIITTKPFQPELMLNILEKYKVTVTITPPYLMALLLQSKDIHKTDLSNLKQYVSGGSYVPNELCVRMKQFLPNPIYIRYGMSELCGLIAMGYPNPKVGAVGKLASRTTIKIVNSDGNRCGPGVNGEICFWSHYPFLGYYGNAEATTHVYDKEGWLKSGDIGHFDHEGYLYVVDRIKDILKYRGNQITPSEVENQILEHKGVAAVCVVGIPDLVSTDLPAAVVLKNGVVDVTEQEIIDIVKDTQTDPKQLRGGVYFVESMPKTPSGKIMRRKVKIMATELYEKRKQI